MTIKKSEAIQRAGDIHHSAFKKARAEAAKFFITKSSCEPSELIKWLLICQSAISVGKAEKAQTALYYLSTTERLLEEALDPQN